ncbi:SmpA/OmlA protein [Salinisphaera hydrothermalis C27AD]
MKLIAALVMLLALSACSLPVFFRVPIVQGNIVTADQVAKLQKGMTKKQVAYVLGTPLIQSPFEADRWDYVFYYRNPNAHVRQSKLDLHFVNGKLSDIEGDEEYASKAFKSNNASGPNDSDELPAATNTSGAALDTRNAGTPNNSANTGSGPGSTNAPMPGRNRPSNVGTAPQTQPMGDHGEPLPGQRPITP